MSNKNRPPKWVNVYPQGTKEGDEEQKFFIALARHVKYVWRSTSALAKESGLSSERVDEIITKYYNKGMVFQNPKNEDQWGYWERCPSEFYDNSKPSIVKSDQNDRIDNVAFSATPSSSVNTVDNDGEDAISLSSLTMARIDLRQALMSKVQRQFLQSVCCLPCSEHQAMTNWRQ